MKVLLWHGLAGTPFELGPVAAALRAAGHEVHCPVLAGHGSTVAAYLASGFCQWREQVRATYARLAAEGPVLLGGYSLGGILALDAALYAQRQALPAPAGLLCLATPVFFHHWFPFFAVDWRFCCLPLWARIWPVRSVPPRSAASRAAAPWQGHETVCCLRHFHELEQALPQIRRGLPALTAPLCLAQFRHDDACHVYNARYLARHCGARHTQVHILRTQSPYGAHLPMTHAQSRQRVARLCVDFAASLTL